MHYQRVRHHQSKSRFNPLGSKRIAVAFCAAIAMVLGAMSVGATLHINTPASEAEAAVSSDSPIDNNSTSTDHNPGSTSSIPDYTFPSQQVLVQKPQPLFTNSSSSSKPKTNINLGPISALVENKQIKLEVNIPIETPVTPSDVNVVVPVPDPVQNVVDTATDVVDHTPLGPILEDNNQNIADSTE